MDNDQKARLRALCSVDADPVRVHRADLADLLDAIDAARTEGAEAMRADISAALDARADRLRAGSAGERDDDRAVAFADAAAIARGVPVRSAQEAVAGAPVPGTGERAPEPAGGPCAASWGRDGGGL